MFYSHIKTSKLNTTLMIFLNYGLEYSDNTYK